MNYNIAVIRGDGIGPEIVGEAIKALNVTAKRFGFALSFHDVLMGGCAIDATGVPLPEETIRVCKASSAVLLGAVGGPKWDTLPGHLRPEAGLLGIRAALVLYANLRPAVLFDALKDACPNGIDGYFENVGGYIFDAVLLRTNAFARIALCGMIAGYDGQPLPMANPALLLVNRIKLEGFIVSEHMEVWGEALTELGGLVAAGKLKPRETVSEGLASAPAAFLGLLKGKNFGKQLVKITP